MNSKIIFFTLAGLFMSNVSDNSSTLEGELLLKSGFEEGVSITSDMNSLSGSDVDGHTWDLKQDWISRSGFVYIVNQDKHLPDYMESVIETATGPHGNQTRVLRMTNKRDDEDHPATSRNEFSFFTDTDGKNPYQEGYVKYWMRLQDNLADIIPVEKPMSFYMIMEWKEPDSGIRKDAPECEACCKARPGGTNNYRININVVKEAESKKLYWRIRGEHPQPCRKEEWRHNAKEHRIPLGEWFLVEAYMKKHETNGRVYFAVNEEVILDTDKEQPVGFTGRTQHAENPMPLKFWSPLKNYHSMEWNRLGPVSHWYDDFEIWTSFPPGHPAGR